MKAFDQELTTKFDIHEKLFGNPLLCKHLPSSEIDEYIGTCSINVVKHLTSNIDEKKSISLESLTKKDYAAEENEEEEEENATVEESNNESIDSLVISGWNEVDRLAKALIDQEGISLSIEASNVIIWLHQQLDHYGKRPIKYEKIKMKPATCPQRR